MLPYTLPAIAMDAVAMTRINDINAIFISTSRHLSYVILWQAAQRHPGRDEARDLWQQELWRYLDVGRSTAAGEGLANFAASIATLGCTSVSSVVVCPSVHVTIQRKGNFTPATSR